MDEGKKAVPVDGSGTPEGKEVSLDNLKKVTGGSLRDTVRTKTEDITDDIKDRI